MIQVFREQFNSVDERETLRYLGVKGEADGGTAALIDECREYVLKEHSLAACMARYEVKAEGDNLDLGFVRVKSNSLARNLQGCDSFVLFAGTAGVGIDRLIAKYSRISPARASVIQAMGSALVESWCDVLCEKIRGEYGETKPRFSCGFGDLSLSLQRDIFAALNITKNIGITLSENCFMTPTKSVTAFVGIKRK